MDGGVSSRPKNNDVVKENIKGINSFLSGIESDFFLFQEVDRNSARTFKMDEAKVLNLTLLDFESYFTPNFKVFFVPVPFFNPIGKVCSGLLTQSKVSSQASIRVRLPGQFSWPKKLFHLKRCMLVSKHNIKDSERKLVVINLHLTAYDKGDVRKQQMDYLKEFVLAEYKKGNFVVVGGDWNQRMLGIEMKQFGNYTTDENYLTWAKEIDKDWTPEGWKWIFDKTVPSVRNNESAYVKGKNFTTVIDGFFVSPSVEVVSVKTFDLGFEFSDHNPVIVKLKFVEVNDEIY